MCMVVHLVLSGILKLLLQLAGCYSGVKLRVLLMVNLVVLKAVWEGLVDLSR